MYGDAVSVRVATAGEFRAQEHGSDGAVRVIDPDAPLVERLTAVRRAAEAGEHVVWQLVPSDGPVAAAVTAAVEAGARTVVLPEGEPLDGPLARDVRRAADVTIALLVERDGALS